MGLSIRYRGQLNNTEEVYGLVEEVKEIADIQGWTYTVLDEEWKRIPTARFETLSEGGIKIVGNTSLKGIQFTPHLNCEQVWLLFTATGYMSTPFRVALDAEECYPEHKVWISTETHFAGVDVHISIINLLRRLKDRFISDLEVEDDGHYWRSKDAELLKRRFAQAHKTLAKRVPPFKPIDETKVKGLPGEEMD